MGVILPKPIMSKVVERVGSPSINAAVCSINGFRNTMEDAHMMLVEPDRMLFGVFDGHSNDKCSAFVAEHLPGRLKGLPFPIENATLEKMCLDLDEQFLEDVGDGGTTATFCIVEPNKGTGFAVTVCNVGDSRILVIRDGRLIFATEDHKPMNAGERMRIEKCGGHVRMNRVDGDLAVSRAFGDGNFKRNRDDPRSQKVIAVPDVSRLVVQPGDIMVVSCDGVFEGSFTNDEVAAFVSGRIPPQAGDIGLVAARVCDQAVRRGSKDNITCMVVHFASGSDSVAALGHKSFVPGPPFARAHEPSRVAYAKMAAMAGYTLGEALQQRYQILKAHLAGQLATLAPIMSVAFEMSDDVDVDAEKAFFGEGPTSQAPEGQAQWFQALADGSL